MVTINGALIVIFQIHSLVNVSLTFVIQIRAVYNSHRWYSDEGGICATGVINT